MMLLSENIEKLFTASIDKSNDRITYYSISFTASKLPSYQELEEFVNSFPARDCITITLYSESENYLEIRNNNITEVSNEYAEYITDSDVSVDIRIDKEIIDHTFSIYDFQSFSLWLCDRNNVDVLSSFHKILRDRKNIIGKIYSSQEIHIITPTIAFTTSDNVVRQDSLNRLDRIKIANGTINFLNIDTCSLIPEDFHIVECSDEKFSELFPRLNALLSMIYLSNISSLDANADEVNLQLQGKLTKTFAYDIKQDIKANKHLFDIYHWVYSGENYYDKLLIARNIISLHCRTTEFAKIDSKTYSSILANYNLYLQKSVTDYLNLKNRLSEFLIEMNAKCSSLISQQMKHITGNIVAFFSFISMVFLINLVSTNRLDNIFTQDVVGICNLFLFGSFIYCLISYGSTKCHISSIQTRYEGLKESYTSILGDDDISTIFNNDDEFNQEKARVKCFSTVLMILWILLIVITCLVISHLS